MIDVTGQVFGQLRVRGFAGRDAKGNGLWQCQCECGSMRVVRWGNLKSGQTHSCGCWNKKQKVKHGHHVGKESPTYNSWDSMKQRCTNSKHRHFRHYGGRGITHDERWDKFQNFLEDMGERPEGKTLDRIDVNGNYTKMNCRWATAKEQRQNQRC